MCVLLVLLLLGHGRAHGSSEAGPMDAVLPQQPRRDDDFVRMADVGACDELWSTWPAMQDRAVANGTVLIWKMGTSIGNIMKTFMFVLPVRVLIPIVGIRVTVWSDAAKYPRMIASGLLPRRAFWPLKYPTNRLLEPIKAYPFIFSPFPPHHAI